MTMIPLVPISHLMDGVQNDALGFGDISIDSGAGGCDMTAAPQQGTGGGGVEPEIKLAQVAAAFLGKQMEE